MKLTSFLSKQLAFFVRISIYLVIIFIAHALLSGWSHSVSPMVGAATLGLLVPACLLLLILQLVAYFTNSGILYILLTTIYVFFTVSVLSNLVSGDIEGFGFTTGTFLLYVMAYSLIFAYSSYFIFRLKGKSGKQ
jgi:hypothetical protein